MTQPTTYLRQYNFTNYQTLNPTSPPPGTALDAEFSAVKVTLDGVLANLKLIQRDDGQIANLSVGYDQFKTEVVSGGINPASPWLTATAYAVGTCVSINSIIYRCAVAHTSGTFATDLANGKWSVIIDLSSVGSFSSGTFTGNGATTAYNLGIQIVDANRVIWVENGAVKTPGTDYTISGTTLTRTVAPGVGVAISWRILGSASATFPADLSVTTAKLVDQSVTTAKLADLSVTLAKMGVDSVDSSKVVANSLVFADLQQIATQHLVGRNTAAAGDMEQVTTTQALDWLGATQGQVLYRDAAAWAPLAPASNTFRALFSGGAAANPSWAGAPRLLTSGVVSSPQATLDIALGTTYDNFELYLFGIEPVAGSELGLRVSNDGGATYPSGGGAYSWTQIYGSATTTTGTVPYNPATGGPSTYIPLTPGALLAAGGSHAIVKIKISRAAAGFYPGISWQYGGSAGATAIMTCGSGIYGVSAASLTHVRIFFATGTNISVIKHYMLFGVPY